MSGKYDDLTQAQLIELLERDCCVVESTVRPFAYGHSSACGFEQIPDKGDLSEHTRLSSFDVVVLDVSNGLDCHQ